jgi:hypothetical protein
MRNKFPCLAFQNKYWNELDKVRFMLSLIILFAFISPSFANEIQDQRHTGYSGFSEITLKTGNTRGVDNETSAEQWSEIIYKDLNTHKEIGMQFSFKLGSVHSDAEIYQLYLKQPYEDKMLIMGRFEQIDARGFYTLDGVSLKPINNKDWWVFIGTPKRIDAYNGIEGGFLMGVEKRLQKTVSATEKHYFRVGLQQQWKDGRHSPYLNLGFTQSNSQPQQFAPTRLNLSAGLRLDHATIENFIAKARFNLNQQETLYLSYDHYRPTNKTISFHERFYQSYALKSQDVLRADWYKKLNTQTTLNLQARQVWHQQGNNGQGLVAGLRYQAKKQDWQSELRADHIQLANNQSTTLYANVKQPLSALLMLELEAMLQQKDTKLTGKENNQGLALRFQQMLKKQLRVEGYAEYIQQSARKDEYQFGLRLRKDFHNLAWGD